MAADIFESELVLLLLGLGLHHPFHNAHNGGDKPRQHQRTRHVEESVEQRQRHRYRVRVVPLGAHRRIGVATHNPRSHAGYQVQQGMEHHQRHQHAYNVKHQVRPCRPLTVSIRHHRGKVGGDRGTDILTHHQRHSSIQPYPTVVAHHQRDGHHRRRRLHQAGQQRTNQSKQQYRPKAEIRQPCQRLQELRVLLQIGHSLLQKAHAYQQQRQTHHKLAYRLQPTTFGKHKHQTQRTQQHRQTERATALAQAEEGDNPRRHRSADIGTHNHRHRTGETQQTRIHKRHHHHRRRARRLYQRRHRRTRQDAPHGAARHPADDVAHLRTRELLQALAHQFHTKQKHRQRPSEVQHNHHNLTKCHIFNFL